MNEIAATKADPRGAGVSPTAGSNGLVIQSIWDSARLALVGAVRTAPFWIAAGLLAWFVAGRLGDQQVEQPNATGELGLTDQVVWPFFDVVLSETEASALAAEDLARDALGADFVSYEVRRPDNIGLVEIRVTATTEEAARLGVTTVTDAIVAGDLERVTSDVQDRIEALRQAEADATEQLDGVIASIQETTARFVAGLPEATRRSLDQELQVLEAERDSAQRTQLGAREDLQELDLERQATTSRVELSNLVSVAAPEAGSPALQLAAAVGVALAAALVLNVYTREQGRIQNPAHVRSVLNLPALDFPETPTTSVALARLLRAMNDESDIRMIGVAAIPTGADSAQQMSLALKEVGEDVLVTEFGFDSTRPDSLAFSVLDPFDSSTVDAQLACDAAVIVVWERHTRLRTLRRKIQELEERGLPVRGVLLRREN